MNKLSNFLDMYSDSFRITHEVGSFIADNNLLQSTEKSEGFSELGCSIHLSIQHAIQRIVTAWSTVKDEKSRKAIEEASKQTLLLDIIGAINLHTKSTKESTISTDNIAQHFLGELFDPLLDMAKNIDKDLAVARRSGKAR